MIAQVFLPNAFSKTIGWKLEVTASGLMGETYNGGRVSSSLKLPPEAAMREIGVFANAHDAGQVTGGEPDCM